MCVCTYILCESVCVCVYTYKQKHKYAHLLCTIQLSSEWSLMEKGEF